MQSFIKKRKRENHIGKTPSQKREISTIRENKIEEDLMCGKDPPNKKEKAEERSNNPPSPQCGMYTYGRCS